MQFSDKRPESGSKKQDLARSLELWLYNHVNTCRGI